MELLGTSKVSARNSVTLIETVVDALGISIGDRLAFIKSSNGQIHIKSVSDIDMRGEFE